MSTDIPTTKSVLETNDTRVELEWEGEGLDGDYHPEDSQDIPLLRFAVFSRGADGEWEYIENSSYCCQVDARADEGVRDALLKAIMQEVEGKTELKRICARLSWLSADDLQVPTPSI